MNNRLTIKNIDKILAINSQKIEILKFREYDSLYEFEFIDDNIHSTTFTAHMYRTPCSGDGKSYLMKLWDGISSPQLEYNFELYNVKDPFCLLAYLHDVINDWDNITNK